MSGNKAAPSSLAGQAAKLMLAAVAEQNVDQLAIKLLDVERNTACLVVVTRSPIATARLQAYLDEQQSSGSALIEAEWPYTM